MTSITMRVLRPICVAGTPVGVGAVFTPASANEALGVLVGGRAELVAPDFETLRRAAAAEVAREQQTPPFAGGWPGC